MKTFLLLFAGILILAFGISIIIEKTRKKSTSFEQAVRKRGELGYCPICGIKLKQGEQLKSALFPATLASSERICHVFGCPSCYPVSTSQEERLCPVCKKTLSPDGYLISRMFSRKDGGHHVHILGCNLCRIGRNNT